MKEEQITNNNYLLTNPAKNSFFAKNRAKTVTRFFEILSTRRKPLLNGGAGGARTPDLLTASQGFMTVVNNINKYKQTNYRLIINIFQPVPNPIKHITTKTNLCKNCYI